VTRTSPLEGHLTVLKVTVTVCHTAEHYGHRTARIETAVDTQTGSPGDSARPGAESDIYYCFVLHRITETRKETETCQKVPLT